jgi:hypothetical protein
MRGGYFSGWIVLLTAISLGCGGGSGTRQDVPAGQLTVFPASLNFGNVAVGQTVTKTGTLKAGNASIAVSSADWGGEGFAVSGIAFPLTVPAGQSVSFKVTFAPQKSGSSAGNVTFVSDASNATQEAFRANATTQVPQSGAHSVVLSWHPSNSNAVAYNIYRGLESKGPFAKINSTPHANAVFTDASVQGGETYFYVTTALNKRGKESKPSNQIQVTIPNS